ncbi:MAG: chemotaxis protein CheD [Chloroflexi bacterium]|nr:chemotaxis protein CheD [Chloroflexota bacterium]
MADQVVVPVGIGELRASKDPSEVLVAYGLGSCVGVCMYDPESKVGGLAHVMLPNSADAHSQRPLSKFADQAVPMLMEEMRKLGAVPHRMVCKIAGGAQMLTAPGFSSNGFNVGERNVEAVKAVLGMHRVPLVRADTGGSRGRTLSVHLASGKIMVRTIGENETEL